MSQVFKTTKYSDYLGEERPLLDIYVNFENPPVSPSVTPTISVTPSVTPSLNSSPTPTPSMTSTPSSTTTPTVTPTPSTTPPTPQPESITFSGNGDFGRYNGTYVLTEPVGKQQSGSLVTSTNLYWSWTSALGQFAMFYNPANIQEVFHGGSMFTTIVDTRWATAYIAGPLMLVSRSSGFPYITGQTLNTFNSLLYPSEGTYGTVSPYTGQVTISYNYSS